MMDTRMCVCEDRCHVQIPYTDAYSLHDIHTGAIYTHPIIMRRLRDYQDHHCGDDDVQDV